MIKKNKTTKFLLTCVCITLLKLIKDNDRLTTSIKNGLKMNQLPQKQTEGMIQSSHCSSSMLSLSFLFRKLTFQMPCQYLRAQRWKACCPFFIDSQLELTFSAVTVVHYSSWRGSAEDCVAVNKWCWMRHVGWTQHVWSQAHPSKSAERFCEHRWEDSCQLVRCGCIRSMAWQRKYI